MSELFSEFSKTGAAAWREKLLKDLRDKPVEGNLEKYDAVEDIRFRADAHAEDHTFAAEIPGEYPYTRGSRSSNDWFIQSAIAVNSEKEANEKALARLMSGSTALAFDLTRTGEQVDLSRLMQGIETAYIRTHFEVSTPEDASRIKAFCGDVPLSFAIRSGELPDTFIPHSCQVSGFKVQEQGANSSEEIAHMLLEGHETFLALCEKGFSRDDASAMIHFESGVGSDYFFAVAKLRAFRKLWAFIMDRYEPEHSCSRLAFITSKTGFLNKSLRDPYTNLLRQTTEVLSAVIGGSDVINCQAYDTLSVNGPGEFAERMAVNISLLLKEESYMDRVSDALGGSYAIEALTEQLLERSWTIFREIEGLGGIKSEPGKIRWKQYLSATRERRIESYRSGKQTLIGVNKYKPESESELSWDTVAITGKLIVEQELNKQA